MVDRILGELATWVRTSYICVLGQDMLNDISLLAWNIFCATLRFPRTRVTFEAFCSKPAASPEVARFRLLEMGPPSPHPASTSYFSKWKIDGYVLDRNVALDIISQGHNAITCLENFLPWAQEVSVSLLHPEFPVDISRAAWRLVIATLRIPEVQEDFDYLCSDPHALRDAAGLPCQDTPIPQGGLLPGPRPGRPHPRRWRWAKR